MERKGKIMRKRLSLLVAVATCVLLLSACKRTTIAEITEDPGRFEGKEVNVAGRVTSVSLGALGMGFYQIDDGTGKLYVLSEKHGAPTEGANVGVRGTVLPSFTFLGKNYATVLKESDRRAAQLSEGTRNASLVDERRQ